MSKADRIARVAKGKRPPYFSDPAVDKLHAIVMSLAEELSVVRDRLNAAERLLEQKGVLSQAEVDRFVPDEAAEEDRGRSREAYIRRVMRVVEMELDEIEGRRDDLTVDATLDDLLADPDTREDR